MSFKFSPLEISEVIHIEPKIFGDDRGFFLEKYKQSDFEKNGIKKTFVQFNSSKSQKNVIRGLHYQKKPAAQGKMVSAVSGSVFDVAVDIRKDSPSFGKWVGVELSSEKKNMVFIPEGFAHGFSVLTETAEVTYYCTGEYSPEHEAGIIYNDPNLNINWKITDPVLSGKDSKYPLLKDADNNF